MTKNKKESGQSLIELLVAMSIFVMAVSVITFLILDVYLSDKRGREETIATFLAQEGIEATRSIRDNNWSDLLNGEHGLAISANKWVFQGDQEDITNYLEQGMRKIIIEEIDSNRKKITSQVRWELAESRPQEVYLVTYLTNWTETTWDCSVYCQSLGYSNGICRRNAFWCSIYGEVHEPGGDEYCIGGPQEDTCCCAP